MKRRRAPYQMPAPDAVELLHRFPLEAMRQRRQWCGFKLIPNPPGKPEKNPVIADAPGRNANSTDANTWRTFDEAVAGLVARNYTGIGYALDGDIVGVDLDGERWVTDAGEPTAEATALIKRFGSYTERSISGRGLHILVGGSLPRNGRRKDEAGVEIYDRKRFFIVTGQQIGGTPGAISENQNSIDWLLDRFMSSRGPTESAESAERTETTEKAEAMSSVLSGISGISVGPDEVIRRTQPQALGQRNDCLFDLARGLKFDAGLKDWPFHQLKPLVRKWHAQALSVIGTPAFDESWSDFVRAFDAAAYPLDLDIERWAVTQAKSAALPPAASEYDSEPVRLLIAICWWLASLHHRRRFFLSSHSAGEVLGVTHDKVLRWMRMLCADGVLEVVERGNQRKATRYRYIHGRTKKTVDNAGGHGDNNHHAEEDHDD